MPLLAALQKQRAAKLPSAEELAELEYVEKQGKGARKVRNADVNGPLAMGHWPWAMGNGPQPKSVAMVAMTRSATNLTWPRYASNAVVLDSLSSATSFNACRGQSR